MERLVFYLVMLVAWMFLGTFNLVINQDIKRLRVQYGILWAVMIVECVKGVMTNANW